MNNIIIQEIQCKSAIGKCGFPGGGFCINPYVGCGHNCMYCYSRFMKRFSGHQEEWGKFVDAKLNIAKILEKQMNSNKYKNQHIYIGTVTDPYQPVEKTFKLTRDVLKVLIQHQNTISILTKSNLILRDLDLIKQLNKADVNFTINTLDEQWQKLIEPNTTSTTDRFKAIKTLVANNIIVNAMMGPYWPIFTDSERLFQKFKDIGISHIFAESLNTIGGNYNGVEKVLKNNYPELLDQIQKTLLDKKSFTNFYDHAAKQIQLYSKKFNIPVTIFFGQGHNGKFKKSK